MKGQGNRPTIPVMDGSAQPAAQTYSEEMRAYLLALAARVAALETENTDLKARLKAANIA